MRTLIPRQRLDVHRRVVAPFRVGASTAFVVVVIASVTTACGPTSTEATPGSSATATTATARATATATTTTQPPALRISSGRPYATHTAEVAAQRTADDGSARSLLTTVWSPNGDGPFPVIAFAHGNAGHPRKFSRLFAAWSEAGYVVVAPRFPVSADDADRDLPAALRDAPQQPTDLAFVLGLAIAGDLTPELPAGRIDPKRIAVAGLSLGGGTALALAFGDCCPTLKPSVVIAMSPLRFPAVIPDGRVPLVLIHGDADGTLPYADSVALDAAASGRRWFITLTGASHSPPYEDSTSAHDGLIPSITVAFLDALVLDDATALERAVDHIETSGIATVASHE